MIKQQPISQKEHRIKTSMALSVTALDLRAALAQKLGMNQTAVIELALRRLAREENCWGESREEGR